MQKSDKLIKERMELFDENKWGGIKPENYMEEYKGVSYQYSPSYCKRIVNNSSQYKITGIRYISDYVKSDDSIDELDLSFIRIYDFISLELRDDISLVSLNLSNAAYASFQSDTPVDFDIENDLDLFQATESLKTFLMRNGKVIKSINFRNLDDAMTKLFFKKVCKSFGIENLSFTSIEKTEKKNKQKKLKK